MTKILFSWVGHADLSGMEWDLQDASITEAVRKIVGLKTGINSIGPVKTALAHERYDKVILLWNYPESRLSEVYRKYLGVEVEVITANLSNPTDYGMIYQTVEPILANHYALNGENHYLLSPGTPAMAAIWILLGKTKYTGTFLQVYQEKVSRVEIPFDLTLEVIPELMRKTERILQTLPFQSENVPHGFENIIAQSTIMRKTITRAAKAAQYDVPILLTGESGTGKEMFANAIWKASRRADKPYEAINCAALPANLLESELFGFRKGAFTGADRDKDGAFKRVNGGTLFLDEIGECSSELQAKLLRVLQPPLGKRLTCREFYPVGSDTPEQSDVRIIAATCRNLPQMIGNKQFRSDLFFRIAAISIQLPPLRKRPEDILPLAEALLKRANQDFRRDIPAYLDKIFCKTTIKFIARQQWLGNVRELFNAILQGIVMCDGKEITADSMGCPEYASVPEQELSKNLDEAIKELKIQYIENAMQQTSGNKAQAAKLLGMTNYQRLDAMMKKLNLSYRQDV